MTVLDNYQAVITAKDQTAPGVASARRTISQGLKNTGAAQSGAEAEKAAGSWGRFGKALGDIPGNLRVLYHSGGLGRAVDEFKEMRRATDEAGASLRAFVPATAGLAALGTAAGFGETLRNFASFGTQLRNTAGPLNINSQELQAWQGVAGRFGVATNAIGADFAQLNAKIRSAAFGENADDVSLFRFFNISPRDAHGRLRKVTDVIDQVFAQFKANAGDPGAQKALLDRFGLGDLDPVFRRLHDLKELHEELAISMRNGVLSPEAEERANRLNRGFANLEQSTRGFANAVSAELEPTFGPILQGMSDWLNKNRENEQIMGAAKVAVEGVAAVVGGVGALTLVGALGKATAAVTTFNAAWIASPLGLFGLGVGAIAGLYEGRDYMTEHFPLPGRPGSRGRVGAPRANAPDVGGWFSRLLGGGSSNAGPNVGRGLRVPGAGNQSQAVPSGSVAAQIVSAAQAAGANSTAIQSMIAGALGEGNINEAWKSGDNRTSFGPWQLHRGAELDRYLRERNQPGDVGAQARYVLARLNEIMPGFSQSTDIAAQIDAVRRFEGSVYGNQPGSTYYSQNLAGAKRVLDGLLGATSPAGANDDRGGWPAPWYTGPNGEHILLGDGANAPPQPDFAAASAMNSRHEVEMKITGAPPGTRVGMTSAQGPADFSLRVEHAMDVH